MILPALAVTLGIARQAQSQNPIVLENVTVIDGTGARPRARMAIVVRGRAIAAVAPMAGEVRYYDLNTTGSVFPGDGVVSFPDGGFYLESMDSHGGWIASAVDLVRFLTAVDGSPTRPDVISDASRTRMLARPPNVWAGSDYHYGMGWLVRPNPGNWWHDGSLPGTAALVARLASGATIALVFNAREMVVGSQFGAGIDPKMSEALGRVQSWPAHDLFGRFP